MVGVITILIVTSVIMLNLKLVKLQPTGKNFLVPWLGMRTYLEFGDDPYGLPATQRAQILYYGNLAGEELDPLYLPFPFFTELLFLPIGLIGKYAIARTIWMILLEVAMSGAALIALTYFGWKTNRLINIMYFLVAVFSIHALLPLIHQSVVIIAFLLFWIGLLCLKRGLDEFAGASLIVVLFLKISIWLIMLYVVLWVVRNKRWRVIWGMLMAGGFLIALSFLLYPGWFFPYLRALRMEMRFIHYFSTYTALAGIWPAIGGKVAGLLTVIVLAFLANEWRLMKPDNSRWFLWGISLTIVAMPILGVPILREDLIFLWFPFTYLLFHLEEIISSKRLPLLTFLILCFVLLSEWVLSLSLRYKLIDSPGSIIELFVPSFILAIWLYWIRWRNLLSPNAILEMSSFE